jgi:hypothetical protein
LRRSEAGRDLVAVSPIELLILIKTLAMYRMLLEDAAVEFDDDAGGASENVQSFAGIAVRRAAQRLDVADAAPGIAGDAAEHRRLDGSHIADGASIAPIDAGKARIAITAKQCQLFDPRWTRNCLGLLPSAARIA